MPSDPARNTRGFGTSTSVGAQLHEVVLASAHAAAYLAGAAASFVASSYLVVGLILRHYPWELLGAGAAGDSLSFFMDSVPSIWMTLPSGLPVYRVTRHFERSALFGFIDGGAWLWAIAVLRSAVGTYYARDFILWLFFFWCVAGMGCGALLYPLVRHRVP